MSLVAATAIAIKDSMPYFLVEPIENGYRFYTTKVHKHKQDTSLGAVLRGLQQDGDIDFDNWRLGELSTLESDHEGPMSFYSFEVEPENMHLITTAFHEKLKFVPANKLHTLLETVQMSSFIGFEE